jgi:UDP-N-acetylglucosamine 3-dehydrogenase
VLIEKPMAVTVDAANNLVAAATGRDRVLAAGHVFAYHPAVIAMQKTLATGKLGGLKYANSTRMNMPPPNTKFSVIWDLAVHDVSIALTLNNARPIRVSANGRNFRQDEICDAATISIEFDDDTMSWHHVGWLSAQRARRFFVGCQSGSMEFDDTLSEGKLKIFGSGVDSRSQGGNHSASALEYSIGDVLEPVLDSTSPLETELRQFATAINGGAPPTADGVQGLRTVEVLAAAEESLERSGEPVMIDRIIQQIGK